jgi:hypothetical protein
MSSSFSSAMMYAFAGDGFSKLARVLLVWVVEDELQMFVVLHNDEPLGVREIAPGVEGQRSVDCLEGTVALLER